MSRFHEYFTVSGVFMVHGIMVNFASVTVIYDEDAPSMARAIAAKFMRKRLRKFINLQDEAYSGDRLLMRLDNENNFAKYAWRHYQEHKEWTAETKRMLIDYISERSSFA